ncbi:MAG: hypothetical protein AAGA03_17525, partial [Planctomycetota bacterium]
ISEREQAIQTVRDSLSVEAGDSSSVIKISAKADSPKLAQMIVQKVIDLHLAYHLRANSSLGSLEFFDAETRRLKTELTDTASQLAKIKDQHVIASISAKTDSLERQMLSLAEKQTQAEAALASSTSTITSLEKQLSGESEMVPATETVGMANSAKATMREELYRLQILESELLAKLRPDHPKVEDIRQQIEKARSVFDDEEKPVQTTKGTNVVHQQLRINLLVEQANQAARQAEVEALKKQRERLTLDIAAVNEAELQIASLQRDVDLLDVNYRRYVEGLEQVRIQKELESQRISNVNVVQKASFVESPVGLNNLVVLALGLIASISFGCSVGVICELLWPEQPTEQEPPHRDWESDAATLPAVLETVEAG